MTNIDYDKMWKEIIQASWSKNHLLDGEKTVKMFADEANISEETARFILNNLVKEKKMNKRFLQMGKSRFVVYSPIIER